MAVWVATVAAAPPLQVCDLLAKNAWMQVKEMAKAANASHPVRGCSCQVASGLTLSPTGRSLGWVVTEHSACSGQSEN